MADGRNASKSAMLDRRHMLECNLSSIHEKWDTFQQRFNDPIYMLVDANSSMGKVIARHESQENQAQLREIAKSAIPTIHLACEHVEALAMCRNAGFLDVDKTLIAGVKGLVVPVIVIASGGLMTSGAGAQGVNAHSWQALEDAEAAKVMD